MEQRGKKAVEHACRYENIGYEAMCFGPGAIGRTHTGIIGRHVFCNMCFVVLEYVFWNMCFVVFQLFFLCFGGCIFSNPPP